MNSTFLSNVKETFIQLIKVSFPLILLAALLSYLDPGVIWGAVISIVLISIELRIILKSTIPWISDVFAFLLSDSANPADEDVLVQAAQEFKNQRDIQSLRQTLRRYTDENPKLLRAWLLRVSFLCDEPLNEYNEAIETLKEGIVASGWRKEDKAMFLFKIGHIYDLHLKNASKAATYYAEAAQLYPRTSYGKRAVEKLGEDY